ncbi:MAG: thiamine pyrophosphate-binding protein [Thermoplasmata archaeon]
MKDKRLLNGAKIIANFLKRNNVEYVFTLTGHTILNLYNELAEIGIKMISVRHEQIAAHMADGYFRATHKPGVVITHVGPGLLNATTGVATAALDSSALLVISGDVPSIYEGAGPHQELNMFTDMSQYMVYFPFTKRATRVNFVENLERILDRSLSLALSMRPGPVLISVPMQIFSMSTEKHDIFTSEHTLNSERILASMDNIDKAIEIILSSHKILILAGGGVRLSDAEKELFKLSEILNAPVVTTMGGKGTYPESDERSLGYLGGWGNPYANQASLNADLIIALGCRFGEVNSSSWINGYTFDFSRTKLIRIDIDEKEKSKNYFEQVFLLGDVKETLSVLNEKLLSKKSEFKIANDNWYKKYRDGLNEYYENFMNTKNDTEKLRPNFIIKVLQEIINKYPETSLITDVGWSKNGIAQFLRINDPLNFITPGGLATMGFAPPAALGFKLGAPDRKVIAVVGDGGFTSTISSLFTAVQYKIPVTFLIMNNYSFGTIQGLQRSYFSKKYIGTAFYGADGQLYNPDFSKIAEASGAIGHDVTDPETLFKVIEDSINSENVTVINIPTELEPDVPITGHWSITDLYNGKIKYMYDDK